MPSRGNGWQTPFSTAGQRTHTGCATGAGLPRTPTRPWHAETPPGELRPQCGEPGSTGIGRSLLQRSSHQSGSEKSPRSWYGGTRHPGSETSAEPGSWALDRTSLPSTSSSDSGAMQILANTDNHVDTVPDLVERVRNEIFKSLSRFSERVMRVEVHLSDQNADREGNEFGISRATGRVVSAFRRGSFEVTAWDGRPLSCHGSRG
jgi:hypothetical protein